MITAGLDLGSATSKAVIMDSERILSWALVKASISPEKTGTAALHEALEKAGIAMRDIAAIFGTGYGRTGVSFISENMSEISCHAKGAHWFNPSTRTVIDVGGQDCKVISVSPKGKVLEFVMNDKCAAGTGKFFEAMARTLDCSLDIFSELSLKSLNPCAITKQCSVFAESEVITLINAGTSVEDIAAGLTDSIARRLLAMIYRIGADEDIVLTGGCAKNKGLIKMLENKLEKKIIRLENPQIAGAAGAALFAIEKSLSKNK